MNTECRSSWSRFDGQLVGKAIGWTTAIVLASLMLLAPSAEAVDRIELLPGANGAVFDISEPDSAGVRYLGGDFTAFNEWDTGGGALTDATDGAINPSFPKVDGAVYASAPDGQGGFYIGGNFSSVDGVNRDRVAHINADGSLDSNWNPPAFEGGEVRAIAFSGEQVYIGGSFVIFDPAIGQWNNAAALDPVDGTPASDWNLDLPNSDTVYSISFEEPDLPLAETTVYLGGYITSFGGSSPCGNLIKIVGSNSNPGFWDSDFCPNPDSVVLDTAVASGPSPASRTVYVGGVFSQAYDRGSDSVLPRNGAFAIITSEGPTDGDIVADWHPNPDGAVDALEVSGPNIYLGGNFDQVDPTGTSPVETGKAAAFTSGGDLVESWSPDVAGGTVSDLEAVGTGVAEEIYMAGSFDSVAGEDEKRAAAVTGAEAPDAGRLLGWQPNPGDYGQTITVQNSGAYLGGEFRHAGGTPRSHLAAVGSDGHLTEWSPEVSGRVSSLAVSGSTVYVGGSFYRVNGENPCSESYSVAAISTSGALDPEWAPCPYHDSDGESGEVEAIEVAPDGSAVYIGGFFDTVLYDSGEDEYRSYAAAFSPSGASSFEVTEWDPSPNNPVYAIAASGSAVYLGGEFEQINGADRARVAAVDTLNGVNFDWDPSFRRPDYSEVFSLELSSDGSTVYVGGIFSCADPGRSDRVFESCEGPGAIPRNNAAAVSAVGQPEAGAVLAWDPGVSITDPYNSAYISDLVLNGSEAFIGGRFEAVGAEAAANAGKVAATGAGAPFQWNPRVVLPGDFEYPRVHALGVSGTTVFLGGDFTEVGGEPRYNTAAVSAADASVLLPWPGPPLPPVDDFSLTVSKAGSGQGSVLSSPAGIDCGSACSQEFADGTEVTLEGVPDSGSSFAGWTGAGCTGTDPCVITMDEAKSVTATFTQITHQLSVEKTGSGSVTSSPAGIDCGATCQAQFNQGSMVTLTAAPDASYTFTGWSGSGCTGTDPCVITMDESKSVDAGFALSPGKPKLEVSFSAPSKVGAGKPFPVTTKVTNVAPLIQSSAALRANGSEARDVKTCLKLPVGLRVVRARGGKVKGRTICWTRSSLAAGSTVTFRTTVRTLAGVSGSKKIGVTVSASNTAGTVAKFSSRGRIRVLKAKTPRPQPPTG